MHRTTRGWKVLRSPEKPVPCFVEITQRLTWANRNLARTGTSHIPEGDSLQACDLPMPHVPSNGSQSSLVIFLPPLERAAHPWGEDLGSEVRRGRCAPCLPALWVSSFESVAGDLTC